MDVGIFQRSMLINVSSGNQQALTICPIFYVVPVSIPPRMIFVAME